MVLPMLAMMAASLIAAKMSSNAQQAAGRSAASGQAAAAGAQGKEIKPTQNPAGEQPPAPSANLTSGTGKIGLSSGGESSAATTGLKNPADTPRMQDFSLFKGKAAQDVAQGISGSQSSAPGSTLMKPDWISSATAGQTQTGKMGLGEVNMMGKTPAAGGFTMTGAQAPAQISLGPQVGGPTAGMTPGQTNAITGVTTPIPPPQQGGTEAAAGGDGLGYVNAGLGLVQSYMGAQAQQQAGLQQASAQAAAAGAQPSGAPAPTQRFGQYYNQNFLGRGARY